MIVTKSVLVICSLFSLSCCILDSGGDQWPEIESVWDTLPPSTATQATPTDHAQKLVDDVASQNAAKLQEAEDRKREEEEAARYSTWSALVMVTSDLCVGSGLSF